MVEPESLTGTREAPLDEMRTWREQLARGILRVLVVVGILMVGAGSYYAYVSGDAWLIPVYLVIYGVLIAVTFWKRVPFTARAGTLIVMLYAITIMDFLQDGRGGSGRMFLLALPLLSVVFFGRRAGIWTLVLTIATVAAFGWAYSTGVIMLSPENEVRSNDPAGWISNATVLLAMSALLTSAGIFLLPRFAGALAQSQTLTQSLRESQENLERQVADRTADLARRARYLEATAEVARGASALLESPEVLLGRVVDLISQQFELYHTGLFLIDESREWAELRAASSEGGRRMLARGHRLRVGEQGIVGYVAERGAHRLVLDVGEDAVYLNNPDLRETRCEMALPLRARGQVIGVLDVQSVEPEAFSDEDVGVLQALADQVAVAISNARLFQRAEAALASERQTRGEMTRQAWADLLRSGGVQGFQSDASGTRSVQDEWDEEMLAAVTTGEISEGTVENALAVPVKARDQVIGVIDAHLPDGASEWTAEQRQLLESVAEQLGVALESAQLYREAQSLATRERLTAEITGQMRSTISMDELLQTAIRETARALDASRAFVRWVPSDESQGQDGGRKGLGE